MLTEDSEQFEYPRALFLETWTEMAQENQRLQRYYDETVEDRDFWQARCQEILRDHTSLGGCVSAHV